MMDQSNLAQFRDAWCVLSNVKAPPQSWTGVETEHCFDAFLDRLYAGELGALSKPDWCWRFSTGFRLDDTPPDAIAHHVEVELDLECRPSARELIGAGAFRNAMDWTKPARSDLVQAADALLGWKPTAVQARDYAAVILDGPIRGGHRVRMGIQVPPIHAGDAQLPLPADEVRLQFRTKSWRGSEHDSNHVFTRWLRGTDWEPSDVADLSFTMAGRPYHAPVNPLSLSGLVDTRAMLAQNCRNRIAYDTVTPSHKATLKCVIAALVGGTAFAPLIRPPPASHRRCNKCHQLVAWCVASIFGIPTLVLGAHLASPAEPTGELCKRSILESHDWDLRLPVSPGEDLAASPTFDDRTELIAALKAAAPSNVRDGGAL